MFGMSQQQQVALIQQMAQLQLMNGMQKTPNNLAGGKLQKSDHNSAEARPKGCRNFTNVRVQIWVRSIKTLETRLGHELISKLLSAFAEYSLTFKCRM